MQLNETNIVNQFQQEIQFSYVVPGETPSQAVVGICTNKVKGMGYCWFICQTQTKITLWSNFKSVNEFKNMTVYSQKVQEG